MSKTPEEIEAQAIKLKLESWHFGKCERSGCGDPHMFYFFKDDQHEVYVKPGCSCYAGSDGLIPAPWAYVAAKYNLLTMLPYPQFKEMRDKARELWKFETETVES